MCVLFTISVSRKGLRGIIGDAGGLGTDRLAIFPRCLCLGGVVVIKIPKNNKGLVLWLTCCDAAP
jgi:hypothetical protein